MNKICMKDVPREVWDEVYAKWERALDVGWSESMWTGCSLCSWMAGEIEVDRMREFDCGDCPLYEERWCRSLPGSSKIHPEYDFSEVDYVWKDRVNDFMEFIRPYCSKAMNITIKDDVLEFVSKHDGMYDVLGVVAEFDSYHKDTVFSAIDDLEKEGLIFRCYGKMGVYSLCVSSLNKDRHIY